MAGSFELFADEESQVRFTLVALDGTVLAISRPYPDKRDAAAAIKDVRECAGPGLIKDLCPARAPDMRPAATANAKTRTNDVLSVKGLVKRYGGQNAAPHCILLY